MRRCSILLALALSLSLPPPGVTGAADQAFADAAFQGLWWRTDQPVAAGAVARTWLWGPAPLTPPIGEPYAYSGPAGKRLVQYFDKGRMEIEDRGRQRHDPY